MKDSGGPLQVRQVVGPNKEPFPVLAGANEQPKARQPTGPLTFRHSGGTSEGLVSSGDYGTKLPKMGRSPAFCAGGRWDCDGAFFWPAIRPLLKTGLSMAATIYQRTTPLSGMAITHSTNSSPLLAVEPKCQAGHNGKRVARRTVYPSHDWGRWCHARLEGILRLVVAAIGQVVEVEIQRDAATDLLRQSQV